MTWKNLRGAVLTFVLTFLCYEQVVAQSSSEVVRRFAKALLLRQVTISAIDGMMDRGIDERQIASVINSHEFQTFLDRISKDTKVTVRLDQLLDFHLNLNNFNKRVRDLRYERESNARLWNALFLQNSSRLSQRIPSSETKIQSLWDRTWEKLRRFLLG